MIHSEARGRSDRASVRRTMIGVEAVDRVTPEVRSGNLSAIRNKDMKPELAVLLVHGRG